MFDFENMGFCMTVGNVKYLTCADCEGEVCGFHVVDEEPKRFYVAHDRICTDSATANRLKEEHPRQFVFSPEMLAQLAAQQQPGSTPN
jgi:hypothetical protein